LSRGVCRRTAPCRYPWTIRGDRRRDPERPQGFLVTDPVRSMKSRIGAVARSTPPDHGPSEDDRGGIAEPAAPRCRNASSYNAARSRHAHGYVRRRINLDDTRSGLKPLLSPSVTTAG